MLERGEPLSSYYNTFYENCQAEKAKSGGHTDCIEVSIRAYARNAYGWSWEGWTWLGVKILLRGIAPLIAAWMFIFICLGTYKWIRVGFLK